uniref:Uncharacterized protein n=1 Tax=Arundo donax TaxID=35708 RepID=A0A0A9BA35_ARUDO
MKTMCKLMVLYRPFSNKLNKRQQHLLKTGARDSKCKVRWALDIHHNSKAYEVTSCTFCEREMPNQSHICKQTANNHICVARW